MVAAKAEVVRAAIKPNFVNLWGRGEYIWGIATDCTHLQGVTLVGC